MSKSSPSQMTWLITGTSNGFGLALAALVLTQNHNVVSLSRHDSPHTRLVSASQSSTGVLRHLRHDLSNDKEHVLKSLIHDFLSAHQDVKIDVLINNAALAAYGPVEMIATSTIQYLMTVNFYSPLWLIQAILPGMRASTLADHTPKVIVNISSTQGLCCSPAEVAYEASKHALEALSGVLAKEVATFGVRTIVVNLGSFRTGFATSGDRAGLSSEGGIEINPYMQNGHPVKKRIDMVKRYANVPNAARGDVDNGAALLFDGVMAIEGSEAHEALARQREGDGVERLLLGSDGFTVIERHVQNLLFQVKGCEVVSKMTDAADVQ